MSAMEKLQKAVETTIAAGYQLDKEAFEFLKTAAVTEDPLKIVNKALEKMENQKKKRSLLTETFWNH